MFIGICIIVIKLRIGQLIMLLRNYQQELKNGAYHAWSNGAKVVFVVAPTGAGKTVIIGSIVKDFGNNVCCIAHRQELVGQISKALAREGIVHNIIAATATRREIIREHVIEFNRSFYDPQSTVTVAGVDTLLRRDPPKNVKLWITDESHHILKENKWGKAAALFPDAKGLGVTASPERADGKGLGVDNDGLADVLVTGPDMRQLIDNGFLCDYRVFAPPSDLDLSNVNVTNNGDYSGTKLSAAASKSHLVGDVVTHYLRIAPGKRAVVFAIDVSNAEKIASEFKAAGVLAEFVCAKTTEGERNRLIRKFRNGEITVLVNVDLFGEGFDLPAIEVCVMARPTMSFALYLQQFGRALRPMPGKDRAIIIDHVGNVMRHGLPDKPRAWSLNRRDKKAKSTNNEVPLRSCTECLNVYERTLKICPFCGDIYTPLNRSDIHVIDGDLTELDAATLAQMRNDIARADNDPANWLGSTNHSPIVKASIKKEHAARMEAQQQLRDAIAIWAGKRKAAGDSIDQAYKRFYWSFGVDVITAQTLKRKDTEDLLIKVVNNV